jgi:hypothetical protein
MVSAFWSGRRPAWFFGGLAVAVVALTVWLLRSGSGGNVSTVLALPVSVASLTVAVWGLVPIPALSQAARDLSRRVAQERGGARRQALGLSGDARPANVRFRPPGTGDEPELLRWRTDGGPGRGTLRNVAAFYQSLDRGRMVILGEPGAGKTVLASQLVLDLIQALPGGELQTASRPPVPVWLSLTSADLGEPHELASTPSEELSSRFDQWMAKQVSVTYRVPGPTAERLVREGWVLPVLDGLDEMDPPIKGTGGPRLRAAAVVRALNAGTGRRPVVLACRRGEYGQLARSAGGTSEDPVLQDATQIVLQPLQVPAICDYLTQHFPQGQPVRLATRWQGVRAMLRTSQGREGTLAAVLSSPWLLFLAVTAYLDDATDPGELTRMAPDQIPTYLLDHLIPAMTRHVPGPGGRQYQSSRVRTWLTTLAVHLDQTSGDPRLHWSPTDLHLQRLWPIAGRKAVQLLTALTVMALIGAAVAIVVLVWLQAHGTWVSGSTIAWVGVTLLIIVLVVLGCLSIMATDPVIRRLSPNIRSGGSRRRLIVGLAVGLTAGLAADLASNFAVGLVVALVAGLGVGLAGNFSLAAEPTTVMRQNITYALVVGLAVGVAVGLGVGLEGGSPFGPSYGLVAGLTNGLAAGVAVGLIGGLATWIRYVIGCMLARRKGMLPQRVGQFLDWAYRANLLRMSGTGIQFRHRELQVWLSESARN